MSFHDERAHLVLMAVRRPESGAASRGE